MEKGPLWPWDDLPDHGEDGPQPDVRLTPAQGVEVMCQVPAQVAVERFFARSRGGPHDNDRPGLEQRIRSAVDAQRPLGVDACQVVDTTEPVDLPLLAAQLRGMMTPLP